MNDKLRIFWMILSVLFVGFLVGYKTADLTNQDFHATLSDMSDLDYSNACIDGCYNMKEVVVGKLYYDNTTHNTEWNKNCSDMCFGDMTQRNT